MSSCKYHQIYCNFHLVLMLYVFEMSAMLVLVTYSSAIGDNVIYGTVGSSKYIFLSFVHFIYLIAKSVTLISHDVCQL